MQSQNPFLDELAKMTTSAMSLAQAAGDEAKAAFRAQADRFVADMDLVRREDVEAMRAEIAELRVEIAALRAVQTSETKMTESTPGKAKATEA